MDCPNCNTWNPDDKDVCWRCQTPLPKVTDQKKKRPRTFAGFPIWMWIVLILLFAATSFGQCMFVGVPGS
ncbi:hypothetical protein RY27_29840 [Litorilinea aerophila]|jgi:predicted nucleic acid-binding Zn ribbon protein|uniref:RanBP2-type domain-containing protein n=1 Tax=Litorilinea aerophila TaxID=1204385 RepID=A0A540VE21_9CHLR|nr:hypothetical protein RY27_29840 [Litorilinea aerophila]GIV79498.1 MAG: hypothetical protein KatS3mg050_3892 [Litorilinea sp.]